MHASIFSYSLSRAYPFRWFTPAVVIGGIIATALVTFLSVGTAGYQLVSVSSSNPNVTESAKTWFGHGLGAIIGSMQPACASTTIPLDTVLYSNNTALAYTLTSVTLNGTDGSSVRQGSLVYHNNPLQNCTVPSILVEFEALQRPANNIAIQQQGAKLTVDIVCLVETPQGIASLNLSTVYEYIHEGTDAATRQTFIGRNSSAQASLYWAESALQLYWTNLTNSMYEENKDPSYQFYKGSAVLERDGSAPTDVGDVESLDFFDMVHCFFIPFSKASIEPEVSYCGTAYQISTLAAGPGSGTQPFTSIWIPLDSLAKSLYYTVLTDLGQVGTTYPNIFTDVDLLSYFTQNFTAIAESMSSQSHPWGENVDVESALASTPFSANDTSEPELRVNPSTLATNYVCQVPQLKPTSSLIVAVLVADLVLLQTIWKLFKMVTDWLLMSKHPELKYCEGCLRVLKDSGEGESLVLGASAISKATGGRDYVALRDLGRRSP